MWWRRSRFSLKGKVDNRGQTRGAVLPPPALSTNHQADPCNTATRGQAQDEQLPAATSHPTADHSHRLHRRHPDRKVNSIGARSLSHNTGGRVAHFNVNARGFFTV